MPAAFLLLFKRPIDNVKIWTGLDWVDIIFICLNPLEYRENMEFEFKILSNRFIRLETKSRRISPLTYVTKYDMT